MKCCVYKKVRDAIPGFRDTDIFLVECFDNKKDADELAKNLNETQGDSEFHEGFGAGSGSIDTSFYVECK